MAKGLNVGRLVNVTINLSPLAAARRGFGTLLIMGDSDVITKAERLRTYTSLDDVASDFGVYAEEYKAAQLYFSQSPTPKQLMVGCIALNATPAIIEGAILTDAESAITEWTSVSDGSLIIRVNGTDKEIANVDLSDCSNLNAVANVLNTAAADAGVTFAFDGQAFSVKTTATGADQVLGYASAATSGTDLSAKLKLTADTALGKYDGEAAETLLEAVKDAADKSAAWYGLAIATSATHTQQDFLDLAGYIEGATPRRVVGFTETDTRVLSSTYDKDLPTALKKLSYRRSLVTYSQNPYAICSMFGRAFTVNFNANKSTITLMYKQEPSVVAEYLTETQANVLKSKNCNVFVNYSNETAIIQYGQVSNGTFFDEVHGLDWLSDAIQTELYNLLYQSKTKIPQTDEGQNQLINAAAAVCNEGVNNGLIAAGVWNAEGFGQLEKGQYLTDGYYIYSEPISYQAQSEREQRKAPPLQIAVKLAGAIHTVDATIEVNR